MVDVTEYLSLPQSEAGVKLGIPASTLSKRWKAGVNGRKWPHRRIEKLNKRIKALEEEKEEEEEEEEGEFSPEDQRALDALRQQRKEQLKQKTIK